MHWVKRGKVFSAQGNHPWMMTHAQLPIADRLADGRLRIYFGTRDERNRTTTGYVEVASDDCCKVLEVSDRPALTLGTRGTFDESGAMPSCIVNHAGNKFLFYTGWNVGVEVPYRLAIGVAISRDGGRTFQRESAGPILDRSRADPFLCASPFVLVENDVWRMWYVSGVKWESVEGRMEPYYNIRYAESADGASWKSDGTPCIDFASDREAGIARPSVLRQNGFYRMWYSYRNAAGYRTEKSASYRVGYADSPDGVRWTRRDDEAGLVASEVGWDSDMIAYPFVFESPRGLVMLYNGNGFGASGFGWATAESA